jgi:Cysteine-rich secretory protein family
MQYWPPSLPAVMVTVGALLGAAPAHADQDNNTLIPNNKRLNDGVMINVYTLQHQAGCRNSVNMNPQLQSAAQRHTHDVLNNRGLDGDIGSDGSTPEARAQAAGFRGKVAETVAINPALAINGLDVLNQWYYNPADYAIMSNCAYTLVGVWSENSPDRSVVVALYGQPEGQAGTNGGQTAALGSPSSQSDMGNYPAVPFPDYDGSDELEYGLNWLPWILRGVYPPPAYPPS